MMRLFNLLCFLSISCAFTQRYPGYETQCAQAENPDLCSEILQRVDADQAIRNYISNRYGYEEPLENKIHDLWMQIDDVNTTRMKQILERHGWPGKTLVGEEASSGAWTLIQHADFDVTFQQNALSLLEQAVTKGEANIKNLAYLTDRVKMNSGQPQIYVTQVEFVNGIYKPYNLENPEAVDERRAAVGLIPLEDYLKLFEKE
jgi:hypothetical protein